MQHPNDSKLRLCPYNAVNNQHPPVGPWLDSLTSPLDGFLRACDEGQLSSTVSFCRDSLHVGKGELVGLCQATSGTVPPCCLTAQCHRAREARCRCFLQRSCVRRRRRRWSTRSVVHGRSCRVGLFNDLLPGAQRLAPFRAQQPQSAEAHLLRFQGGIDRSTDGLRLHAMLREHAAPFSGVCP